MRRRPERAESRTAPQAPCVLRLTAPSAEPLEAALALAYDLDIYAYDAYVIRCALQYRCPVLTLDAALRTAALGAGAHVVELEQ